jgi:hypothetical protein
MDKSACTPEARSLSFVTGADQRERESALVIGPPSTQSDSSVTPGMAEPRRGGTESGARSESC